MNNAQKRIAAEALQRELIASGVATIEPSRHNRGMAVVKIGDVCGSATSRAEAFMFVWTHAIVCSSDWSRWPVVPAHPFDACEKCGQRLVHHPERPGNALQRARCNETIADFSAVTGGPVPSLGESEDV